MQRLLIPARFSFPVFRIFGRCPTGGQAGLPVYSHQIFVLPNLQLRSPPE
jgi:hypothetical protein